MFGKLFRGTLALHDVRIPLVSGSPFSTEGKLAASHYRFPVSQSELKRFLRVEFY